MQIFQTLVYLEQQMKTRAYLKHCNREPSTWVSYCSGRSTKLCSSWRQVKTVIFPTLFQLLHLSFFLNDMIQKSLDLQTWMFGWRFSLEMSPQLCQRFHLPALRYRHPCWSERKHIVVNELELPRETTRWCARTEQPTQFQGLSVPALNPHLGAS